MCSSAIACPQVSKKTQSAGGTPTHDASAASNMFTNTVPTSRRTHSSKIRMRNSPHCSDLIERSVTTSPSSVYRGRVWTRAAPTQVCERQEFWRRTLHNGDQLDEPRSYFIAQEAVDLQRVIAVARVHRGQHIEFNPVLLHQPRGPHDFVECGLSAFVHAVEIVHFARPIDAEADQKVVFTEEFAPLVVQQRAVCL